jgi:Cd2+/Zn2+-exporting ATPase
LTSVYSLPEMCCINEAGAVEKRLRQIEGVEELSFDFIARRVEVRHRLADEQAIQDAFRSLSMSFETVSTEAGAVQGCACCSGKKRSNGRTFLLLGLSGALALGAEAAAWALGSDGHPAVIACALAAFAMSGKDVAAKGWASVRTFTLNINFLMVGQLARSGDGLFPVRLG